MICTDNPAIEVAVIHLRWARGQGQSVKEIGAALGRPDIRTWDDATWALAELWDQLDHTGTRTIDTAPAAFRSQMAA